MGKEAKTNLNEGLGKVSPDICVLSYEQLSSSVPWWYIMQALSPGLLLLLSNLEQRKGGQMKS
jgi:hypothetical protein